MAFGSDLPSDRPAARADPVHTWQGNGVSIREDWLAIEEPLQIRLAGINVAVTMRTPGYDFDLVRGFLFGEGIIDSVGDIASIGYCEPESPEGRVNTVNVNVHDSAKIDSAGWQRNFYVSSSCGVCGKASIESVRAASGALAVGPTVEVGVLYRLETQLRNAQRVFADTGGLHAAGLFDAGGRLQLLREDVGRHNAVDKVVGAVICRADISVRDSILMVSGRSSFELVQKALRAGIPILAGVSAPSSLAVTLARDSEMTLVGFLRGSRCNVYAGAQRIVHSR